MWPQLCAFMWIEHGKSRQNIQQSGPTDCFHVGTAPSQHQHRIRNRRRATFDSRQVTPLERYPTHVPICAILLYTSISWHFYQYYFVVSFFICMESHDTPTNTLYQHTFKHTPSHGGDRCLWKINDIEINNVSDVARVLGGGWHDVTIWCINIAKPF